MEGLEDFHFCFADSVGLQRELLMICLVLRAYKCECTDSAIVPGPFYFLAVFGMDFRRHVKGKMNCKVSAPRQYADS